MDALAPITVRHHGSSNKTLVVLHGGPGAPGSARGLALALAERYRVLEPFQRWSGSVRLTVAQHVNDLGEVLHERATLVGHSWGAMLALSYAATFPERVSALVLVGCGTYDEASREAFQRAFQRLLTPAQAQRRRELRDALEHAPDEAARDAINAEFGLIAARAMTFDEISRPEYDRVDAQGHHETWEDAMRLQREGIEPARFAAIGAPAIMLHGDRDPHPGGLTHAVLHVHMPQLEYVGLPQCGHEPWRERQARTRFLRLLFEWVQLQPA